MTSNQIKPYCQTCKTCKMPDQFNITPRKTYKYICKICELDKQKQEAAALYETTKKKIEDQTAQQHQLAATPEKDYIVFHCPYKECNILNIVYNNEIHCGIFRCGYDKVTNQQIGQHTSKTECDILRNNKNIIGCVQPYRLIENIPVICDYI